MSGLKDRFLFASAPDSWGVLDYPGPSWKQSYEKMLDEMVSAGYTGTELGPYGFFPTDAKVLQPQLDKRKLTLLASFVPVKMTDPAAGAACIERIRKIVADAEKVANEFGLDLVFHPHVATYVETPEECELFYDATSHTNVGLCLDTGHCVYGHGDSVKEAEKYKDKLRFVHIKDCDTRVLEEARRKKWTFEEAIEHKVFTIIGQGNIDFPAFFRTLVKNGYSGWSVVEQDVKFGATPIPPVESVAASLKYLRGVVSGLGTERAAR